MWRLLTALLLLLAYQAAALLVDPARANSTWISGSSKLDQLAVLTPAASAAPGARHSHCAALRPASAATGNTYRLYVHGGVGLDAMGVLTVRRDMWLWSQATLTWQLVRNATRSLGTKGVDGGQVAYPGELAGHKCDVAGGSLFLFGGRTIVSAAGGSGTNATTSNLLWRFNMTSGSWIWETGADDMRNGVAGVKGVEAPQNTPSARHSHAFVAHPSQTMLLLFGGRGLASTSGSVTDNLNDLWKYNVVTQQWTLLAGSVDTLNSLGVYGIKGVLSSTNVPSNRLDPAITVDNSTGMLYLFGGQSTNATSNQQVYLNDAWKFQFESASWAWLRGGPAPVPRVNIKINYFGLTNIPGARTQHSLIAIPGTSFLALFGGFGVGLDLNATVYNLNDLWLFNTDDSTWAFMGGDQSNTRSGIMGALNVESVNSVAPPRFAHSASITGGGEGMLLFGGQSVPDANLTDVHTRNDLWRIKFALPVKNDTTGTATSLSSATIASSATPSATNTALPTATNIVVEYSVDYSAAWIAGSDQADQAPDSAGPGSRSDHCLASQMGTANTFVAYGGNFVGAQDSADDMWQFDVKQKVWSSIQVVGISAPGPLSAHTCDISRTSGIFYLFGGRISSDASPLNLLWSFDFASQMWTLLTGSASSDNGINVGRGIMHANNTPSARAHHAMVMHPAYERLVLFGGHGYSQNSGNDTGYLNDLWQFNITAGQWTFLNGSVLLLDRTGVYGTKGVYGASTTPPGREGHAIAIDPTSNDLLMFGGSGIRNTTLGVGYFNDMWRYDFDAFKWSWVSGVITPNSGPVIGNSGDFQDAYMPGARHGHAMSVFPGRPWVAVAGGFGYGQANNGAYDLTDVWLFSIASARWAYVAGDSDMDQRTGGVYGIKGLPSASNLPSPRAWGKSCAQQQGPASMLLVGGKQTTMGGKLLADVWQLTFQAGDTTSTIAGSTAAPSQTPDDAIKQNVTDGGAVSDVNIPVIIGAVVAVCCIVVIGMVVIKFYLSRRQGSPSPPAPATFSSLSD